MKIERLCERAECLRGRSHGGSADKHHAHCVSSAGRSTVIAIRRFRPTASGYRLVKDASDG
ncbi:MAG: hypothetical protein M0010_18535 [Actinomycetota bacterium]|nr:hypothetical protein [Actinomycetota bacterium]